VDQKVPCLSRAAAEAVAVGGGTCGGGGGGGRREADIAEAEASRRSGDGMGRAATDAVAELALGVEAACKDLATGGGGGAAALGAMRSGGLGNGAAATAAAGKQLEENGLKGSACDMGLVPRTGERISLTVRHVLKVHKGLLIGRR
jgi:hypothetical protein